MTKDQLLNSLCDDCW